MVYLQVSTPTCSTFLISHHTNPARFLLHSKKFLIQLLQKNKKFNRITLHQKKFSTKLYGSMSDKNRTKNHESNTEIIGVVHCNSVFSYCTSISNIHHVLSNGDCWGVTICPFQGERLRCPRSWSSSPVVLYCTYMHPYVHRTCMYNTSGPWNLMLSGHANY